MLNWLAGSRMPWAESVPVMKPTMNSEKPPEVRCCYSPEGGAGHFCRPLHVSMQFRSYHHPEGCPACDRWGERLSPIFPAGLPRRGFVTTWVSSHTRLFSHTARF